MSVAFIIPCLNEEPTIGLVVESCRQTIPEAEIYVFDNNSTDQTAATATSHGAVVISSPRPGKGHVVRHAFAAVDADHYILLDGDGTYPVEMAPRLLQMAREHRCDMVMGCRLALEQRGAFRPLHYLGNLSFTMLVRLLFGGQIRDLLTGYRVFNRRFAKEIDLSSTGFEIETELTLKALRKGFSILEVQVPYRERPVGSHSKLRTFVDGWRILRTIIRGFWTTD